MSIEARFGNLFKAEVKTAGKKLVAEEKVSVTSATDTTVQAYIRATPPLKVMLLANGVGSPSFTAECGCPPAKRGQFCKHIWGTLLAVEEKNPDFLSAKWTIDNTSPALDNSTLVENSYQATAKMRAAEYRKEQYQKQKARTKQLKERASAIPKSYPQEVEAALAYFAENGFPMSEGPSEVALGEAKRKLSRVFHPDRGGSHDESVELNRNWELLLRFLRS